MDQPKLHHQMFIQVYNLDPIGTNLLQKGISNTDACPQCGIPESLFHNLIMCEKKLDIWHTFQAIYGRINRIPAQDIKCDDLFRRPFYRYFPPTRRKFSMWLIAVTLYILKRERVIVTSDWYVQRLNMKLWTIPKVQILKKYACYYRAVY